MRAAAAALRCLTEGPDWPLLAVAGLAWVILLAADRIPGAPPICVAGGADPIASGRLWLSSLAGWDGVAVLFAALVAMPVAMTAPLLQVPLSHVRRSALYERRTRSLAFFLAGHLCAWALTVTVLMALAFGLRLLVSSAFAATGLVLAAGPDLARHALQADRPQSKPCAAAASRLRRAGRRGCNALWRPVRRLVRRLLLAIDARDDDGRRRASRNDGRRSRAHAV